MSAAIVRIYYPFLSASIVRYSSNPRILSLLSHVLSTHNWIQTSGILSGKMIPPHIDTSQPSPTLLLNADPPALLIGCVAIVVARPRVLVLLSSLLVRGQGNADWLIRVARAPASFSGDPDRCRHKNLSTINWCRFREPVKSKFFGAH